MEKQGYNNQRVKAYEEMVLILKEQILMMLEKGINQYDKNEETGASVLNSIKPRMELLKFLEGDLETHRALEFVSDLNLKEVNTGATSTAVGIAAGTTIYL